MRVEARVCAGEEMEVDEDLEAGLLRQFNCMLTTDKEVLVKELQGLVGAHLNEHSARFYLEMTDWWDDHHFYPPEMTELCEREIGAAVWLEYTGNSPSVCG